MGRNLVTLMLINETCSSSDRTELPRSEGNSHRFCNRDVLFSMKFGCITKQMLSELDHDISSSKLYEARGEQ